MCTRCSHTPQYQLQLEGQKMNRFLETSFKNNIQNILNIDQLNRNIENGSKKHIEILLVQINLIYLKNSYRGHFYS